MTRGRDIERVMDQFYADGPTEMPDRVFVGVLDRIERVPQRRLAHRLTRFARMTTNFRLAAAAAIVVAVVGLTAFALSESSSVGPPASPTPSAIATDSATDGASVALPEAILGRWTGAPRVVAGLPEPPHRLGLLITATGLQFPLTGTANVQFASTASQEGSDQIRLRLSASGEGCQFRDEGTYRYALSTDGRILTLTPVADQCAARAEALTGEWIRAACPIAGGWCHGDLPAGTHVSTLFTPILLATGWEYTYGALSFVVPNGWANTTDGQVAFALAQQGAPQDTGIVMWSNMAPHSQTDMCSTAVETGVGPGANDITNWLASLPGLVTSDPVPTTIDALSGWMIDLSIDPAWTATCPYASPPGSPLVSLFAEPGAPNGMDWNIQGGVHTRIIALDTGFGGTLVIDIEGQNQADFEALLPEAMDIVNGFTFRR